MDRFPNVKPEKKLSDVEYEKLRDLEDSVFSQLPQEEQEAWVATDRWHGEQRNVFSSTQGMTIDGFTPKEFMELQKVAKTQKPD